MSTAPNVILTDDTDPNVTTTLRRTSFAPPSFTLDWASPMVAVDGGAYTIAATWLGDVGPVRQLQIPLGTLAVGLHRLYLRVPSGSDIELGTVRVKDRT